MLCPAEPRSVSLSGSQFCANTSEKGSVPNKTNSTHLYKVSSTAPSLQGPPGCEPPPQARAGLAAGGELLPSPRDAAIALLLQHQDSKTKTKSTWSATTAPRSMFGIYQVQNLRHEWVRGFAAHPHLQRRSLCSPHWAHQGAPVPRGCGAGGSGTGREGMRLGRPREWGDQGGPLPAWAVSRYSPHTHEARRHVR